MQNESSKYNHLALTAFILACMQTVLIFLILLFPLATSGEVWMYTILILYVIIPILAIFGFIQSRKRNERGMGLAFAAITIQVLSTTAGLLIFDWLFENWRM